MNSKIVRQRQWTVRQAEWRDRDRQNNINETGKMVTVRKAEWRDRELAA